MSKMEVGGPARLMDWSEFGLNSGTPCMWFGFLVSTVQVRGVGDVFSNISISQSISHVKCSVFI